MHYIRAVFVYIYVVFCYTLIGRESILYRIILVLCSLKFNLFISAGDKSIKSLYNKRTTWFNTFSATERSLMTTADKRNSETPSPIRTYKVEDLATMLNIGRSSAYNLVKEGHFKTVRIGNAIRISKKSFDEWLDSQSF